MEQWNGRLSFSFGLLIQGRKIMPQNSLNFKWKSRFVDDLNGIFQPIILGMFFWAVISICGTLLVIHSFLVIQTKLVLYFFRNFYFLELFFVLIKCFFLAILVWWFNRFDHFYSSHFEYVLGVISTFHCMWTRWKASTFFSICYLTDNIDNRPFFGERVSNEFVEMDDVLTVSFNWYKFPLKTWRIIPIVTICVQQPVRINCFGKKIGCTREIFQKVCSNQNDPNHSRFNTDCTCFHPSDHQHWILILYGFAWILNIFERFVWR